nr:FtsX-like permease family protein [Sphingomicrobium sp. B8]
MTLARRDLRGGLGGLGLLWACLLLSVAGLAAVLSLTAAMDKAIGDNQRAILGGDLLLSIANREATEEELAAMRDIGPVSHMVETRGMLNAPDGTALAELRSIDENWPLAGEVTFDGERPEGLSIAIDPLLSDRLLLEVGDTARLGFATVTIGAIIDEMPQGGAFNLAPPILLTEEAMDATGLIVPGSIVSHEYRMLIEDGRVPEEVGRAFQERFEDAGWREVARGEAAGGVQRFVARTGDMLLLIALAALGIGTLGIASAARAFAASRRATVARLKLVGAQRKTLAGMLGLELAAVALAALIPGLLLGMLAPGIVTATFGDQLPILPDPGPHWQALGLAAAVVVLAMIAAAWRPLAEALAARPTALLRDGASTHSARRRWLVPLAAFLLAVLLAVVSASNEQLALRSIGALVALGIFFAFFGWLIRVAARTLRHRGGPVTRLGIAALDRPGNATVRLTVALGLGLSLLVALAATGQSILKEIDQSIPNRAPSVFLLDIPSDGSPQFREALDTTLPNASFELVPSLRGPVVEVNGTPVAEMQNIPDGAWILRGDRGLTFLADLPEGNNVVSGEWWPSDYDGPPQISLDVEAAQALGLEVGDTLTISILGRPIEATISSLRTIDWRSFGFNFAMIFAPGTLEEVPHTQMATVTTPPDTDTRPFERALVNQLPQVSAIRVGDIVAEVRSILVSLDAAIRVAVILAIAMGVVVLAGAVVATRRERARDLVLLRLVGASRAQLTRTQLIEFLALSTGAAAIALGAGVLASWIVVTRLFEFAFSPDWPMLIALGPGAVAVAVIAALLAAWPAISARPARALRTV